MGAWVIFRRARIALFCFLVLICITWATLLAVFLFYELSHFSRFQKIIVASSLSLYGFTAILLYLMAITHFRFWWDVARLLALLVVHTGSSVLFTIQSPRFPCQNFETVCRKFVHVIFIGCWVLSGIILCFSIALGVMALTSRPVESVQGTEEVNPPPTPASFKAGSPTYELRFSAYYSIDSRTGFVTYNDGGISADCTPSESPVNSPDGETMWPPRLWKGFENPNLSSMHSNNTDGGTISARNAPTELTSVIPGPPPPASIYSQASMIRPGVGRKDSSIAENRLNQSAAFPGPSRDALLPTFLHRSPSPVATPRDLATEYAPTLHSFHNRYPIPPSSGNRSQREQTYPDRTRTATPGTPSPASVRPMWMKPTPHKPPPPALTPDITRFRGSSPYLGPKGLLSRDNTSLAAGGSNAPLTPKPSESHRTIQHHDILQSYHPPVEESSLSRKGGGGQVLDQTQWRRLVLNAAAGP